MRDDGDEPAPIAVDFSMEVLDALDGFCVVEKRSPTLDGSVPLRAAQGCKPFLEGNAAGFQLRLAEPALLQVQGDEVALRLTDDATARIGPDFGARVRRLVDAGVLLDGGYWHRLLKRGVAWRGKGTLMLWTGLLVRPAPGLWVLQSGAFNRRVRIAVADAVIADEQSFVPVILELSLASARGPETWLDTELGCLTPLWPDVGFTVSSIEESPDVGHAFNSFYSPEYLERRGEAKNTGAYRRLFAAAPDTANARRAECRLVVGGPNIHRIGTFRRFLTGLGRTASHPRAKDLRFAVIKNICDVDGDFDGQVARAAPPEMAGTISRFRATWKRLYGPGDFSAFDSMTRYVNAGSAPFREPFMIITPWTFVTTPAGWSSITDGYHHGTIDGMRGVIDTDTYFVPAPAMQVFEPGPFTLPRGTPIERIVPVPRHVLDAPLRTLRIEALTTGARQA